MLITTGERVSQVRGIVMLITTGERVSQVSQRGNRIVVHIIIVGQAL